MKKSEFASLGIITEYDLRYLMHHMRSVELRAAKRKPKLYELHKRLEEALKNSENVRRIDRGAWQVMNIQTEDMAYKGFHFVSYEMRVFQEGIILFVSRSEAGETYPGEDSDYGRNSFCISYFIEFDEE